MTPEMKSVRRLVQKSGHAFDDKVPIEKSELFAELGNLTLAEKEIQKAEGTNYNKDA
jgi:hypothetical protein